MAVELLMAQEESGECKKGAWVELTPVQLCPDRARTAAGLNINAFRNDFELGDFSGAGTNLYRQHCRVGALQCT